MSTEEIEIIVQANVDKACKEFTKMIPAIKTTVSKMQENIQKFNVDTLNKKLQSEIKLMQSQIKIFKESTENNEILLKINNIDAESQISQIEKQIEALEQKISGNVASMILDFGDSENGEIVLQNLSKAIDNLLISIKNVVEDTRFQNFLVDCSNKLVDVSNKINQIDWTPLIASLGDIAIDGLNGLADILKWIAENPVAAEMIVAIAVAITVVSTALGILSTVLGIFATMEAIATAETITLKAVVLPAIVGIIMLVAAIALVITIIMNWSNICEFIGKIWDWLCQKASEIFNGILETIRNAITGAKVVIEGILSYIQNMWNLVWNGIMLIVTTIWNIISTTIINTINNVKSVIESILNHIQIMWNLAWNGIMAVINFIWNIIVTNVTNAINNTKAVIESILNVIQTIWSNIWNGIMGVVLAVWNFIMANVTNTINNIKNTISNILNAISTIWSNIWNGILNTVSNVWNGIWNTIKGIVNKILGGIEGFVNGTIKGINKILSGISSVANAVGSLIGLKPINLQLNTISLPRLAKGNVAFSPLIAQFGEYAGASYNPEITAPQSILKETFDEVLSNYELNGNGGKPVRVQVYLGTKAVVDEIIEGINEKTRQTGKAQIKVAYS